MGDYNGDGRDDLLCYVRPGFVDAGRKRIDFADGFGKFYGTNFDTQDYPSADQAWCANAGEEILVGDFNGDDKDDLLCFVSAGYANEGRKRIDFANGSGTFFGTEFDTLDHAGADQTWCTGDGERLHVGDFNGDGRDDLLCHVNGPYAYSGRRRVDLANDEGTFFGANWSSTYDDQADEDWCGSWSDEVEIGDVDADGRDDLICAMWDYGGIDVDHVSPSGAFHGTDGDMHDEYYDEITDTSCQEVLDYANPPSIWYTAHCDDDAMTLGLDPANCFPNSCGATTQAGALACELRECQDPRINKPGAVTIVIADLCDWDLVAGDVTRTSCNEMTGSFASINVNSWGEDSYDAVFDYWRMMRGPNTLDILQAQGVEQHELGHIFGLSHHDKCEDSANPMHRTYSENGCMSFDSSTYRLGGYSALSQIASHGTDQTKWYGWVNQIDVMIDTARDYKRTSCN